MVAKATHEGTCGICEGVYCTRNGAVVMHGFQRPGLGYLLGSCWGQRQTAWELSPEPAREYLETSLRPYQAVLVKVVAEHRDGKITRIERARRHGAPEVYTAEDADQARWKRAQATELARLEGLLRHVTDHVRRLEKRLVEWKPAPLRPLGPAAPKILTLTFVEPFGPWVAAGPTGRTIVKDRTVRRVLADAALKGWHLPDGATPPAEVTASDLLRKAAAGPTPKNLHRLVNDRKPDAPAARLFLELYARLTPAEQAVFDARPYWKLLQVAGYRYLDELDADALLAALRERLAKPA